MNKWFNVDEIRLHLALGFTHILEPEGLAFKRLFSEVLKLLIFEKWLRKSKKYYRLLELFLKQSNQNDLRSYFSQIFTLIQYSINKFIILAHNKEDKQFLNYLSEQTKNSNEWDELISLKEKPIFKISEEEFVILENTFIVDKFFSGLYHELLSLSKEKYSEFHQDFSKSFAEEYLLESTLNCVFRKSYIKLTERAIKEKMNKGDNLSLPDYYIRNGNKILLIEFKNSYLSNPKKIKLDFDLIESEIKEKFYYNKKRKKAIKQLIGFIYNSSLGKYDFFDKIIKKKNLKFYPIIIVTDRTLLSLGFNKLFNEYFNNELESSNFKNVIKPLTIIHIDTLLYYNKNLKKLDRLIEDFHLYISKSKWIDSMISFEQFLSSVKLKNYSIKFGDVNDIVKNSMLPNE